MKITIKQLKQLIKEQVEETKKPFFNTWKDETGGPQTISLHDLVEKMGWNDYDELRLARQFILDKGLWDKYLKRIQAEAESATTKR